MKEVNIGRQLTMKEYIGVIEQEYYLAIHAYPTIRMAGVKCKKLGKIELGNWFLKHAEEEFGHHFWALHDLHALGLKAVPASLATMKLMNRMMEVGLSDKPWGFLALSFCAEHTTPMLDLDTMLPDEVRGKADKYLVKHAGVDIHHAKEVDEAIAALDEENRTYVENLIPEFGTLFLDMLKDASGIKE